MTLNTVCNEYDGGFTPLMISALDNNVDLVKKLLLKGVDIDAQNENGETALTLALNEEGCEDVVCILVENGANLNTVNYEGITTLMRAVCFEDLELVKKIVELGVDINAVDKYGDTAIKRSVTWNFPDIFYYLLEKGAKVSSEVKEKAIKNGFSV
jgi:ankyrin repeat protein